MDSRQYSAFLVGVLVLLVSAAPAAALDLNSSKALQYFSGNQKNFEVLTGGDVNIPSGDLDVSGGDLFVDHANSRVGVSTSNPQWMFEVEGSNPNIVLNSSLTADSTAQLRFINDARHWQFALDGSDDNFKLRDSTAGSYRLIVDTSGDVEIPNGNLTMNSNWIKSVHDPSSSQDAMTKAFADSAYLNRDGTDSMNGDLDLNGYNVVNVDALGNGTTRTLALTGGGDVDVPAGNITIGGTEYRNEYLRIRKGSSDGNYFGLSPGNAGLLIQAGLNKAILFDASVAGAFGTGGTPDFNISRSGDIEIPNGNLSMNSNYITSVSTATGQSQSLINVGSADSLYLNRDGTDSMTGDLDMNGNNLVNVDALGNGTTRTIQMDGSGNVEIPNGYLSLSNDVSYRVEDSSGTAQELLELDGSDDTILRGYFNDDTLEISSTSTEIYRGGSVGLRVDDSNNLEIPSGNLNMSKNNLTFVRGLGGKDGQPCAAGEALLGDGTCGATGGSQNLSEVLTTGNVANQTMDMGGNNITNVGSNDVDMQYDPGDGRFEVTSSGNTDICIGNC